MPYFKQPTEREGDERAPAPEKSYGDMLAGHQPQSAQMAQAATQVVPQGSSQAPGATASGYLNFGDFYNANSGVANREANKLGRQVSGAAKGAQNALAQQQSGFSQGVQGGTFNQGPRDIDVRSSKQSDALKNEQQHIDEEFYPGPNDDNYDGSRYIQGEGNNLIAAPIYDDGSLKFGASGADLPDYLTQTPKTADEMAALAAQGYTGPNSLSEGAGYADLLAQAGNSDEQLAALAGLPASGEQNLDAGVKALLGPGATESDAALVGAAGRKRFSDINQEYGRGDQMKSGVMNADAASRGEADKARKTSEDTAGEWKKLLGNHDAANAEVDARSKALEGQDKENQGRENRAGNFRRNVVRGNYDIAGHVLRGVGEALDPVSHISRATGNKSPEQYLNEKIDPAVNNMTQGATHLDSTSYLGWTDDDFDVYDSMTDQDWAQFNSLPDSVLDDPNNSMKRKWIEARKQQLRSQPKKKKGGT